MLKWVKGSVSRGHGTAVDALQLEGWKDGAVPRAIGQHGNAWDTGTDDPWAPYPLAPRPAPRKPTPSPTRRQPTKNQAQSSKVTEHYSLFLAVSAIMLKRFGLPSLHEGLNQVEE